MDSSGCNGNQAESDKMIGIAYYKKGDFTAAIKNFQNALDVDYNSRKKGLFFTISGGEQFTDSVAIMYYSYFKDFENCKNIGSVSGKARITFKSASSLMQVL
jgi:tetratricopeptide (TPR) repeat protein